MNEDFLEKCMGRSDGRWKCGIYSTRRPSQIIGTCDTEVQAYIFMHLYFKKYGAIPHHIEDRVGWWEATCLQS